MISSEQAFEWLRQFALDGRPESEYAAKALTVWAEEAAFRKTAEARLAEADKANQLLRAEIAAQSREEDLILTALRLDPERYRTECGYLNVPKIIAAIKHPDQYPRLADSAPAALDLEHVDIHRCPTCGALPRPSLMGGTVCPNGHGNVQQPMPTGSADAAPEASA